MVTKENKTCETCGKVFTNSYEVSNYKWARRRFCSKPCQFKNWERKNEASYAWKGENVLVYSKHMWLYRNYGKADHCENPDCKGKSEWFDWCLKRGCRYEKKRESYLMLCRRCHRKYDMTPDKRDKAVKNLWWYKEKGGVSACL